MSIHDNFFAPKIGVDKSWVTYCFNDEFLPGVIALSNSLKKVGTSYPLICIIGPGVSKFAFEKLLIKGIYVQRLSEKDVVRVQGNFKDRYSNHSEIMFSKLNIFRLGGLRRCVYVDADMIFLRNADELFLGKGISMVPLSQRRRSRDKYSAGLIAFNPRISYLRDIRQALASSYLDGNTDQTLLNSLFQEEIHDLPGRYNLHYKDLGFRIGKHKFTSMHFRILVSLGKVKILHFDGQKPWIAGGGFIQGLDWKGGNDAPFRAWREAYNE